MHVGMQAGRRVVYMQAGVKVCRQAGVGVCRQAGV